MKNNKLRLQKLHLLIYNSKEDLRCHQIEIKRLKKLILETIIKLDNLIKDSDE